MIGRKTVAQWYALLVGILLLAMGIAGVLVAAGWALFGSGSFGHAHVLAIFSLEGWGAILDLLLGLLGLATWRRAGSARLYALAVGLAFLAIGAWGIASDAWALWVLDTTLADDVLHLFVGALGVISLVASPWHVRTSTPRARLDYA